MVRLPVSTGGRTITNLSFSDDIDGLAAEEEELAKLVECLDQVDDKQHQWHQQRDKSK